MKQKPSKSTKTPVPGSPSWIMQALLGFYGIFGLAISMFGGFKVPFAESNAKDYWRHALAGIVLMVALLAGLVSLALYLFNANYFKSQIVDYVKTTTQRDLTLDGDLTVSFFPKLALDTGKMMLSQRNSNKSFASIESGHFHIAWWPLFLKQLQVEGVTLNGVHANITRFKNGSTNLDDFITSEGDIADIKFEIDSIRLTNSSISLQDEGSGYFISLHDLSLETGKLANNLPADVSSTFRLDSAKPRLNGKVKLSTHLLFDLKNGNYELANMEGEMEGDVGDLNTLTLGFQASIKGNAKLAQMDIDKVAINAKGLLEKRKLDARLDIPAIKLNKGKYSGSKLTFNGSLLQDEENLGASLELPAFTIDGNQLKADAMSGSVDLFKSGRTLQAKLGGALNADLEKPLLALTGMSGNFTLTHPALNGKIAGTLNGSLNSSTDNNLNLALHSQIDNSTLTVTLTWQDVTRTDYAFEVVADKLDLDRYLSTDWSKRLQDKTQPFDFELVKGITLHGKFNANELRFAKLKLNGVHGEAIIEDAKLVLNATARLYGGTGSSDLSIDMQGTPKVTLKQKLNYLQLNALQADFSGGESRLSGKAMLNIDANGTGDNLAAVYQSLNGTAAVDISRGNLSGIDLAAILLANRTQLGVADAKIENPAKFSDSTPFNEMKCSYDIAGGIAKCGDFLMKTPAFAIKGTGEMTLVTGETKYELNAAISSALKRSQGEIAMLKGLSLPVRVSGNWNAPLYTVDLAQASGMKEMKPASTKPASPSEKKSTRKSAP